jgi:hypothetical protein
MSRFIAVHPVAFTAEQLLPLSKEQLPEGFNWHATYIDAEGNKTFCHWQAPTMEALREVFAKYEVPYEAIHTVRLFDPLLGQVEPAEEKILQPA